VGARVHVAEADDRALAFRTRLAQAGRPVRLQGQAHRARRNGSDQGIQQRLGADAALGGERALGMRELVLEPAHQPEAALDVDLGVERPGQAAG
jgi:hypothetical protein